MKEKIVMLRLIGGEFIIGTVDEAVVIDENSNIDTEKSIINTTYDKIRLNDAKVFEIQQTLKGVAIALIPMFPFGNTRYKELDRVEINKSVVIQTIDEKYIDGQIINAYRSNVTGIDMSASQKDIII